MATPVGPTLPDPVIISPIGPGPIIPPRTMFPSVVSPIRPIALRFLRQGCYFAQWRPVNNFFTRFNGTMRIERHSEGVTASGDLYCHRAFRFAFNPFRIIVNPDPNPSAGIPIFPRNNYRYYLRVTQVLEFVTITNSFTLGFERHSFDDENNTWTNDGAFTAKMTFKAAPANYPSGATFLEGEIKDSTGTVVGTLTLGWVSRFLRKATLEVDRVQLSEYPTGNGDDVDWRTVYEDVDWDVNVYESDTNLVEPSGEFWSDAEMHATMLNRRDSADLDSEWRYYLLCVRRLDSTSRGIMFDAFGGDSNNVPREGGGLSSHWVIPNIDPPWGTVAGQRFGSAPAPYFRTAVHEIGHAMGLYHNNDDNGFMNTTGVIASSPGTFPANVQWAFNAVDERRLRHMPDPWVRPGMIPFGRPYLSAPISPVDRLDLSDSLSLEVKPQLSGVPIDAPVRVTITLRNTTDSPLLAPASLSIKSGHVSGRVTGPGGSIKGFQSIMRCVDEHEHQTLEPGAEIRKDLTLLRGRDGALFEAPGLHQIKIGVTWEADNVPFCVHGSAPVMVQPAVTDSHIEAALKTLSTPDLLLTLVLGGDHLEAGVEALQAALADETLAQHQNMLITLFDSHTWVTQAGCICCESTFSYRRLRRTPRTSLFVGESLFLSRSKALSKTCRPSDPLLLSIQDASGVVSALRDVSESHYQSSRGTPSSPSALQNLNWLLRSAIACYQSPRAVDY